MLMSFAQAAAALGCDNAGLDSTAGFSSVCIDSREAAAGSLFVALCGEHTDGHRFVHEAFKRGAAAALVESEKITAFGLGTLARSSGTVLFPVKNTLAGLQNLAAAYLDLFPGLLRIGITGSSGKTTTKEIALAMCCAEKQVVANTGNLNSETGLPLSVFDVRDCHEIGIFEAGMNRSGEIGELARVLRPHIALVTNIGSAHIGCLGSRQAIAQEKKALFSAFTGVETALIPKDDDFADFLADGLRGKVLFFDTGLQNSAFSCRSLGLYGWEIDWQGGGTAHFPLPGVHNLKNALAAAALSSAAGVSNGAIRAGFESVKPLFGRGEIIEGSVTVVRDCYNANPESAAAAIEFCDELDWKGLRLYVLGSMLELGANSDEAHRTLGSRLARSKADFVFLYGEETACALPLLQAAGKPVIYTADMSVLRRALDEQAAAGSLILLKASRGCALEQVL